jgi:hydroxymethylpyrimidine/phosphomethylpyrimidine kinase
MGNVVPDRFFWALPPAEDGAESTAEPEPPQVDDKAKPAPRRVH